VLHKAIDNFMRTKYESKHQVPKYSQNIVYSLTDVKYRNLNKLSL